MFRLSYRDKKTHITENTLKKTLKTVLGKTRAYKKASGDRRSMLPQVKFLCVYTNSSAGVLFTCGFHHKRLLLMRNFTCKSFFRVTFQKFPISFSSSFFPIDIGFPKSRVGVNILGVFLNQFPNRGLVTTLQKPKRNEFFLRFACFFW